MYMLNYRKLLTAYQSVVESCIDTVLAFRDYDGVGEHVSEQGLTLLVQGLDHVGTADLGIPQVSVQDGSEVLWEVVHGVYPGHAYALQTGV